MTSADRAPLSDEELAAKSKREEELAPKLEAEFATFSDRGSSPYLDRKLVPKLYGARLIPNPHGNPVVAIPLRDASGKFWNYQRIWSEKFKLDDGTLTDKITMKGARTQGTFHWMDGRLPTEGATIYFAEGFATASSIYQALNESVPVVCALYATNLPVVVREVAALYPSCKIIVCADNDTGSIGKENAGRAWAERAIENMPRAEIRYPVFPRTE